MKKLIELISSDWGGVVINKKFNVRGAGDEFFGTSINVTPVEIPKIIYMPRDSKISKEKLIHENAPEDANAYLLGESQESSVDLSISIGEEMSYKKNIKENKKVINEFFPVQYYEIEKKETKK